LNVLIFGSLAIISLFIFFNLGKMKASSKQLNRNNRVNRFGSQQDNNNIEGEAKEISEDDDQKNS
jgi:hypothetical protein